MALSTTIDVSDFAPSRDGELCLNISLGGSFAAYLKGEAAIRDVDLLRDLPEIALTQVNNHWLVRMGKRIMRIGSELSSVRIPRPICLADEYALRIVILNTEPPQLGDLDDIFPGLRTAEDLHGCDPDIDDPDDDAAIRDEWMNRMADGLLPSEHEHDHRRYDLLIMETFGQGVYALPTRVTGALVRTRRLTRAMRIGAGLRPATEIRAGRPGRHSTPSDYGCTVSCQAQRDTIAKTVSTVA
ncbi:hypothetical protein [Actinoalloteichus sp. AHMU CJ021]|uniref:hypothetical protein n=1 Tax=Actinoalloteichus sp. AHMU CJ021 TaxID=2072503 RepID=UPI0026791857